MSDPQKPKRKSSWIGGSSGDYNKPFKEVKLFLPYVYVDANVRSVLAQFKEFYVFTEYAATSVTPRYIIKSEEKSADITDFISMKQTSNSVAIGYRRQDDILDLDGKLFKRSKAVQKRLELLKFNDSYIRWVLFKLGLFLSKKLFNFRK